MKENFLRERIRKVGGLCSQLGENTALGYTVTFDSVREGIDCIYFGEPPYQRIYCITDLGFRRMFLKLTDMVDR